MKTTNRGAFIECTLHHYALLTFLIECNTQSNHVCSQARHDSEFAIIASAL